MKYVLDMNIGIIENVFGTLHTCLELIISFDFIPYLLGSLNVGMITIDFKSTQEKLLIHYSKQDKVIHARCEKLTKTVAHRTSENYDEIHNDFERKYNERKNIVLKKL